MNYSREKDYQKRGRLMKETFVLQDLHKVEIEILDEIDRICRKNSINYCLVGGTLLGAVRHGGFIPWDDDLDVAMPRNDYEKFIDVCKNELSDDFYLHSIETDKTYWLPFIKIRKKYTIFEEKNIAGLGCKTGIYVDIFPLDDAIVIDSFKKRFVTQVIKEISALYLFKIGFYKQHYCKPFRKAVYWFLSMISTVELHKIQNRLMKRYNGDFSKYFINYGSNYSTIKQTMPKETYIPFKEISFEGKMYFAPNDTNYYLKRIYGENYMELPPVEKRITHNPEKLVFDTRIQNENN